MQPISLSLGNLAGSRKRLLAALWFAAFALLCVTVMFHRVTMSFRGVILYEVLPVLASGIAGGLWGGPILDLGKVNTLVRSLFKGIAVAGGGFVIFSLLFALVLPLIERGWSLRQSADLLLLTWTLGIALAAPIVLFGGMLGGATLFLFCRRFVAPEVLLTGRRKDR
jgi:hypothetical protein